MADPVAPVDDRPVYFMDTFTLHPDVDLGLFEGYKRDFRKRLKESYGWDLVAGVSSAAPTGPYYNFWRIPNSNALRLAMEGLQDEPFFQDMVGSLASEVGDILIPLSYDTTSWLTKDVEVQPAGIAAKDQYVLETITIAGDRFADYDRFADGAYVLREALRDAGWRLRVGAARITGAAATIVHLWLRPQGAAVLPDVTTGPAPPPPPPPLADLSSLRQTIEYQRYLAAAKERTITPLSGAQWEDAPNQGETR